MRRGGLRRWWGAIRLSRFSPLHWTLSQQAMISLRLILLVLVTLGCRELAEGNAEAAPLLASLAAMGISLGFGLLFKASTLHVLAGSPQPLSPACWQRCAQARTNVERAWIAVLPLALLATGWGAALNGLQEQGLPQAVSLLGWFLPSLFLIVLLELTAAQFDELYHQPPTPQDTAHCGIPELLEDSPATTVSWQREWLLRLRLGDMASLVTCLTPVLAIAALTDAASYFANDVWMTRMILAATLLALLAVVLFLPVWLGRWMGVVSLPDGALSQRVTRQMQALNIRGVRPKLVLSRGRWPGAAVVGWFPQFRQLWLGDALIERCHLDSWIWWSCTNWHTSSGDISCGGSSPWCGRPASWDCSEFLAERSSLGIVWNLYLQHRGERGHVSWGGGDGTRLRVGRRCVRLCSSPPSLPLGRGRFGSSGTRSRGRVSGTDACELFGHRSHLVAS
ncbi:MAG: hypothetical protein R3C56_03815 [Pirellulaceae bacterium]